MHIDPPKYKSQNLLENGFLFEECIVVWISSQRVNLGSISRFSLRGMGMNWNVIISIYTDTK